MSAPIILSQPVESTALAQQSSLAHRDEKLSIAKLVTQVTTPDELETAVSAMKPLAAIRKETEAARKAIKAPITALGKQVDAVAADFMSPVEKEEGRLVGLVNHFQREQLRLAEERDRKAQQDAREAERKAQEAAAEIERQRKLAAQATTAAARKTAVEAQMKAELAAEDAALSQQTAALTLSTPTETPKGLVTKTRYDFEITKPGDFYFMFPEFWTWRKDDETLKLNRADLLKALNSEHTNAATVLLPEDGHDSVTHARQGIRVFRHTASYVR